MKHDWHCPRCEHEVLLPDNWQDNIDDPVYCQTCGVRLLIESHEAEGPYWLEEVSSYPEGMRKDIALTYGPSH